MRSPPNHSNHANTYIIFHLHCSWRGPIWMPVNYLLIERLQVLGHYYDDSLLVDLPTGSGNKCTLWGVAHDISERLIAIFRRDPSAGGQRPVHGGVPFFSSHPRMAELIPFFEFFHGDNGTGLGARQQTGWTAMVAKLIQQTSATGDSAASGDSSSVAPPTKATAHASFAPAPPSMAAAPSTQQRRPPPQPGRLNLGPIDTGTVLDFQQLQLKL